MFSFFSKSVLILTRDVSVSNFHTTINVGKNITVNGIITKMTMFPEILLLELKYS